MDKAALLNKPNWWTKQVKSAHTADDALSSELSQHCTKSRQVQSVEMRLINATGKLTNNFLCALYSFDPNCFCIKENFTGTHQEKQSIFPMLWKELQLTNCRNKTGEGKRPLLDASYAPLTFDLVKWLHRTFVTLSSVPLWIAFHIDWHC